MAIQDVNTLKNWFKRGLKPLQTQFWDWLDSYWHKSDSIPIQSVENLQVILNNMPTQTAIETLITSLQPETFQYTAPASYELSASKILYLMVVESTTNQVLNIGTSEGFTDLLSEEPISANMPYAIRLDIVSQRLTSRLIHLHGFTDPITISFHKQSFFKP